MIDKVLAMSIGGGSVKIDGEEMINPKDIYPLTTFTDIKNYLLKDGRKLYDYVYEIEPDIKEYLKTIWQVMKDCVERGLKKKGTLPGGLKVVKKAK